MLAAFAVVALALPAALVVVAFAAAAAFLVGVVTLLVMISHPLLVLPAPGSQTEMPRKFAAASLAAVR